MWENRIEIGQNTAEKQNRTEKQNIAEIGQNKTEKQNKTKIEQNTPEKQNRTEMEQNTAAKQNKPENQNKAEKQNTAEERWGCSGAPLCLALVFAASPLSNIGCSLSHKGIFSSFFSLALVAIF